MKIAQLYTPVCIVLNKVDNLTITEAENKQEEFNERYPDLVALPQIMQSSLAEDAGQLFIKFITPYIPEGPKYYPGDVLTDENMRYFAAEYIRKQIIENTHEEVPHACYVEITNYIENEDLHQVEADIHVESVGQKAIIIGAKGQTISKIRRGAEKRLRGLSRVKTKVIVTGVSSSNAKTDYNNYHNYMWTDKMKVDLKKYEADNGVSASEAVTHFENEETSLFNTSEDKKTTFTIMAGVTGGLGALNVVDAIFMGKRANKKFQLYFSSNPFNQTYGARVAINF